MNRVVAEQIVQAIGNADRAAIEFIPEAIGKRIKRKSESVIEECLSMRRHERKRLLVSALAIRLGDRLNPVGSPFQVFVKDISASGLGFYHTRHWPECMLAIRLPNPRGEEINVFVVGTVRRSICKSGSYEVGIEFTHTFRTDKLDSLPAADIHPEAAETSTNQPEVVLADPTQTP